jgi:protoporphyrinogen/coproporphyrinogen III oxidase
MTKDFLIIGGGLSGLLFAYRLNKSKKNGVVLEASANFGGAISHTNLKNFKVDSGAESFSLVNDSTLQLVRDLGIENHLVFPENLPAYLKFESDFKPIPNGLLGIPGDLSASDLTEIFSHDEISTAKNLDQQSWQISENVTLGELVESRYGQVFVDKLLTPIVMGGVCK